MLADQGIISLSAGKPTPVKLHKKFLSTSYYVDRKNAYDSNNQPVAVTVMVKTVDSFTVVAKEDCTYEWIAMQFTNI